MSRPTFRPLTPDRWADLEALFGPRGACAGCWCMWWRHATQKSWVAAKGEPNRRALRKVVASGAPVGILAYDGDVPLGWCAIAPRDDYPRLSRARTLRPLDDRPVWSITCLFVEKGWRRRGLSSKLIEGATAYAREQGATLLEGYPMDTRDPHTPAAWVWTGLPASFEKAGFEEVARPAPTRPIYRLEVKDTRRPKASAAPPRSRSRGSSSSPRRSSR
ncbi:MAG TPA: GNAT family N-acetyltransferase [Candidatus Polarisedimenticolaceae bacterium]